MESSDAIRLGSFRFSNSNVWANTSTEVFSKSSRDDQDDEEALKWATIERLPTYLRIRTGVLIPEEDGPPREVDVKHLGPAERKHILNRVLHEGEDNEEFLLKLKQRIARVGIEFPSIEVRFENLNVAAEAHVGSRGLPTIFNFCIDIVEGMLNSLHILPNKKKPFPILHDVSGIVKPGRLTLLLGPPSSGKTTLLLALSGRLASDLKASGKITYNGHEMNEFVPQRSSAYISQNDLHLGELTVRETLAFSARCQGVGARHDLLMELTRREKEAKIMPDPDLDTFMKALGVSGQEINGMTDYIIKILGLDVCADTMVGDAMIRGVSGGQKKRVTTGEMMVGAARVFLMDEISTGLDSSTTFNIVKSILHSIHILRGTAVISLLQPAPETYELFDDIILLSEGHIVYQGPRENVLEFFESMGFKCPERKGVADFLQEVTSQKDQEQYWANRDKPYSFIPAGRFSEVFQSFHVGKQIGAELAVPFDKSKSHPAALTTEKYGIIFMALITMTVFLRTKMHKNTSNDGQIFMGALFFTTVMIMFNGFSELALTILRLPIYYKQRDLLFFPAWAYAIPTWILRIPITLLETGIWVAMTYYVIGYDSNAGRFFRQYLVLIFISQMASALFRLMASLGRNMVIANTFGSFALVGLLALGGFVLSHDNIKKWWIWGYWISPMMYAQNAISVNEFLGHSWRHIIPEAARPLGALVLRSRGIFVEARWYWIGAAALIGYILVFNFFYILALTYLKPLEKTQAVISEETLEERISSKNVNASSRSMSSRVSTADEDELNKKKEMVLPFEPFAITFEDIRYAVDMPQEMKAEGLKEDRLELLKGVSGSFRPGVLTALMGVSGAGKTTLMDVLAGRKTGGYIEGTITISGYPKKQETFARIAGYCEQNDIHTPHVTVYESLKYSAWLRLPAELDAATRERFVEEVMELVELKQLREALVGLPGVNGLSTEQRKRLTIAVELVANPSIIFMDEPTSGLDARAAAIVMRTVRKTVDTGRTVVCTIHQPSIDIFDAFDELVLLKRGGEEIYVGPLGHHCNELIQYFEGIRGVAKIRDGYNPATWMLEVSSVSQEASLGVSFPEIYKNSDLYRRNKALIKELSTPAPGSKELHFQTRYSQPFLVQFIACLWKQHLSYWRNPHYTAVRLLFTTVIALMFGTIFWKLGSKRERLQDLLNAMGSMYSAVLFMGIQNAQSVQPVIAIERTVFYRERAAGMYAPLAYAFGQVAIELPYILVQTVIYGVLVYAMIGFEWTAAKFFWYIFFMYFTLLYFTAYGMMAVAVTPNQNIAAIVSSSFYAIWNLFSGFIVPKPRIPVWWRWYYYISPVAWTLYGLVASQFGDIKETMVDTNQTVEDFIRGYFGFKHDFLGFVALIIVAFATLSTFIFAFSIKMFNFQKR